MLAEEWFQNSKKIDTTSSLGSCEDLICYNVNNIQVIWEEINNRAVNNFFKPQAVTFSNKMHVSSGEWEVYPGLLQDKQLDEGQTNLI